MTEITTFGSWLKRARRQLDLTQKELAYQCGCSVGTIRKIEADERQPSRQLARLMAENLDIPPDKQDAFVAFARSEPYIDDLSFPMLDAAVDEREIPTAVAQETFGDLVQARRNELQYRRRRLAELVGCTPNTIRQIERNEGRPSLELAERLAVHLQIPDSEVEQFLFKARGEFVPRYGYLSELSLAEAQTPPAEEEAPKHNLPLQTTQFFGREQELGDIAANLSNPNCRLLTILAAGGMGKTRLAIEAASYQLDSFTDGICYIPLAAVSADSVDDADSPLESALADALGISFHGRDPLEQQLFTYLRRREMLLVFDNFEHFLPASEFVSDLLRRAPDLKIMITSRERLNLQEEWLFPLQGLSYPGDLGSAAETGRAAVDLFSQRALQVRPSFLLEEEYAAVLRICRLVEGMPLGLELAAAWVIQLSCQEIAAEIETEIGFLATEMRNVPQRHRSLRAVFSYSWDKLSGQEQDVLRKLSVFRGGFARAVAQTVAGATLRILAGLVSKALISAAGDGRYAIHELLRQYAAEKLAEAGKEEEEEMKSQHALYFLTFLREQEPSLQGPQGAAVLTAMTEDIDNIRAAVQRGVFRHPQLFDQATAKSLEWILSTTGRYLEAEATYGLIIERLKPNCIEPAPVDNPEISQNCLNLAAFLNNLAAAKRILGRLQESEATAELVLNLIPPSSIPAGQEARAMAFDNLSSIKFMQGDFVGALNFGQTAAETIAGPAADKYFGINWHLYLFNIYILTGELSAAERSLDMAVQKYALLKDEISSRRLWNEMAKLAMIRGHLAEAEEYFQKSLAQLEEIDWRTLRAFVWRERGDNARLAGEFDVAREYCRRSIAFATEISLNYAAAQGLWSLGNLAVDEGKFDTALRYYEEYKRESTLGQEHIGGPGWALLGLRKDEEAKSAFAGSLRVMLGSQTRPIGLDALVGMAHVKARAGQFKEALELLALVKSHPSSYYESREKARKLWAELAAELPPELVAKAETRGRELDLFETAESLLAEGSE